jgi:calcium uptake protein 1, mitochondrial
VYFCNTADCCRSWAPVAAGLFAATGLTSLAICDATPPPSTDVQIQASTSLDLVKDPTQGFLLDSSKKRYFFKYEKRLREFSTHEKMFEYFSSLEVDGKRCMTASDILRALLAVYPPDGAAWIRSGSLAGEARPKIEQVRSLVPR